MNPQISEQAKIRRDEIVVRAFRSLYGPLCGYVRKRIGCIPEVEDLVQDVFESLMSADKVLTDNTVARYAYACARNRVTDYLRHHACSEKACEYFSNMQFVCGRNAEDDVRYHELRAAEIRALEDAGEKGRKIYVMKIYDGLPVKRIAEIMGIGERTAENHLFRVRNRVRRELGKVM